MNQAWAMYYSPTLHFWWKFRVEVSGKVFGEEISGEEVFEEEVSEDEFQGKCSHAKIMSKHMKTNHFTILLIAGHNNGFIMQNIEENN